MLIAEFSHKGEEIEIENELWQYDYGQRIQIKGLDLPETFEVHFAWKDSEKAKVVIGSTVNGISTVDIPNVALEQRRTITAYIYLSGITEGETVNTIILSVNKRKAPENFGTPEDVDLFHHTLAATAEYQRQAKESENLQAEATKQQEFIKTSIDDTLSISGKAADAAVTGKKIDSLKEDISNKITKFYASNQGEMHITDSDNGKIQDMQIFGRSEQKKYNGYQLLALAPINLSTGEKASLPYTEKGITVDIANDGIGYTVRGTNTLNEQEFDIYLSMPSAFDIEAGTYTRSGKIINGNSNVELVSGGGTSSGGCLEYRANKVDFTFTETVKKGKSGNFIIRISPSATVNAIVYFQIEKGSEAHGFEPYVGGQPSPSPDYPQEIKSVVNPTVKVCGKNLWNPIAGGYINGTNGSITECGKENLAVTDFIKINGKDITVIARNFSSAIKDAFAYRVGLYNSEKKWIKNIPITDGNRYSISAYKTTDSEYIRVSAPVGIYNTIQIEYGSEATPYEPYTEQSVQLPYTLNAIPVTSGGNVTIDGQQYIADYVDVERGKVVRMCERGTFNTKNGNVDEEYRLAINIEHAAKSGDKECIFSAFKWVSWETCVSGTSIYIKNIKKPNNELYTAQELKELSLDFDVIYQLSEQQETDLTTKQIQALKELATYYPVTNISVNSEQLDGYTVFDYPISMANGWNYVKKQLNDNRDYIYDMDTQSAEAYVNSEYAVALTELEV